MRENGGCCVFLVPSLRKQLKLYLFAFMFFFTTMRGLSLSQRHNKDGGVALFLSFLRKIGTGQKLSTKKKLVTRRRQRLPFFKTFFPFLSQRSPARHGDFRPRDVGVLRVCKEDKGGGALCWLSSAAHGVILPERLHLFGGERRHWNHRVDRARGHRVHANAVLGGELGAFKKVFFFRGKKSESFHTTDAAAACPSFSFFQKINFQKNSRQGPHEGGHRGL